MLANGDSVESLIRAYPSPHLDHQRHCCHGRHDKEIRGYAGHEQFAVLPPPQAVNTYEGTRGSKETVLSPSVRTINSPRQASAMSSPSRSRASRTVIDLIV